MLIAVFGVFYEGHKIDVYECDEHNLPIPQIRVKYLNNSKVVRGKIFNQYLYYYGIPDTIGFNDVTLELLNDSSMIWHLEGNHGEWPNTALMRKRDNTKYIFAPEVPNVYIE